MDTSEQYIKMCEKAKEIQAIADDYVDSFSVSCWHSPNHVRCKGHFTDWHMGYKYCPVCGKPLKITPEYSICLRMEGDDTIWLPRQDQLQEMVRKPTGIRLVHRFYDWLKSLVKEDEDRYTYYNNSHLNYESLEQLWLAFVMKEKYNKVWNGKEWSTDNEKELGI